MYVSILSTLAPYTLLNFRLLFKSLLRAVSPLSLPILLRSLVGLDYRPSGILGEFLPPLYLRLNEVAHLLSRRVADRVRSLSALEPTPQESEYF